MSILEIRHRIFEQCKRFVSQFYIPKLFEEFENNNPLPKLPGITDKLCNIQNNEEMLHEWKNLAKSAKLKHFQFLGTKWPHNVPSDIWHFDPISLKQWPSLKYCFRINYRNTKEYGDAKYVWELNRLQYLQPIAALAVIKKDKKLSIYCLNEIESWIDSNPPYKGINWASGIELAFRTISIIVVISLIDDSLFTKKLNNKIQCTLASHGYWLMRYPSQFSSANNHLIAEASALYILGTLAPHLPNAYKWKYYGKNTLAKEVPKQIYADGVGAEQSPSYTALTLEWSLLCGTVGKLFNDEFPNKFWMHIEKAGEFIRCLTDKNGNQPNIGDNDESQVIYSKMLSSSYTTSILACITSLNNRPDSDSPINLDHLRYLIFGKPNFNNQSLAETKCFKQGGYTISRSYTKDKEYLLVFDHGPLGYLNIAAHGHADALAIWLHIDGFPVIVDAGTYLYHSGGEWRNHMRSTPAHNTLAINGENSSLIAGAFNWSTKAKSVLVDYKVIDNKVLVCAENNGYQKRFGVKHKRQIQQYDDDSFIVTDSLHGKTAELPVEIGFLFHPDLSIRKKDNIWTVSRNQTPILKIKNDNSLLKSTVKFGQQKPMRGWYSNKFGHIVSAPRLQFEGILNTDHASSIHFRPV
jgi:hypothetical protein